MLQKGKIIKIICLNISEFWSVKKELPLPREDSYENADLCECIGRSNKKKSHESVRNTVKYFFPEMTEWTDGPKYPPENTEDPPEVIRKIILYETNIVCSFLFSLMYVSNSYCFRSMNSHGVKANAINGIVGFD